MKVQVQWLEVKLLQFFSNKMKKKQNKILLNKLIIQICYRRKKKSKYKNFKKNLKDLQNKPFNNLKFREKNKRNSKVKIKINKRKNKKKIQNYKEIKIQLELQVQKQHLGVLQKNADLLLEVLLLEEVLLHQELLLQVYIQVHNLVQLQDQWELELVQLLDLYQEV